jgi:hypothetical protein
MYLQGLLHMTNLLRLAFNGQFQQSGSGSTELSVIVKLTKLECLRLPAFTAWPLTPSPLSALR